MLILIKKKNRNKRLIKGNSGKVKQLIIRFRNIVKLLAVIFNFFTLFNFYYYYYYL